MEINIRKSVIDNMKSSKPEEIIQIINEGISSKDEIVLPGLGVLLEVLWKKLTDEEKVSYATKISVELK